MSMAENSPPDEWQRYRLELAYDGRGLAGWQSQIGVNTVQDLLLGALQSIAPKIKGVHGSGRTDAGVSAERQVAHFDAPMEARLTEDQWRRALNSRLPTNVRVWECRKVAPDFHARFSAVGKHYRYDLFDGEIFPPLLVGLAWHHRLRRGREALAEALTLYLGTHDFRAFSANRGDGHDASRDSIRTLFRADMEVATNGLCHLHISGDGFLYKMVRFLVGTAVYVAEGRYSRDEVRHLLGGVDPAQKAPYCAPPDGLCLMSVDYSKGPTLA
jgi:tRNA pseudouridine38-40 synthase